MLECKSRGRRPAQRWARLSAALVLGLSVFGGAAAGSDSKVQKVVSRGLDWLASSQTSRGNWSANEGRYPTSMTALAGTALLLEGSTTTQGKYQKTIRRAVDYLIEHSRSNGLIGDPTKDDRYTYGHGFSMLFLSIGSEGRADYGAVGRDGLRRALADGATT